MAIAKEYRPSPSSPKALDKTMKNASVARSPRIFPPERLQKLRRICCALIVIDIPHMTYRIAETLPRLHRQYNPIPFA